jgi:hypothetical protein
MAAFNSHAIPIPLPYIAHLAFYTWILFYSAL